MKNKYFLAKTNEIDKRRHMADEFILSCIEPDERPYLITDESTLYDFHLENEQKLLIKVKEKYGKSLNKEHLNLPFWQLLDILERENPSSNL